MSDSERKDERKVFRLPIIERRDEDIFSSGDDCYDLDIAVAKTFPTDRCEIDWKKVLADGKILSDDNLWKEAVYRVNHQAYAFFSKLVIPFDQQQIIRGRVKMRDVLVWVLNALNNLRVTHKVDVDLPKIEEFRFTVYRICMKQSGLPGVDYDADPTQRTMVPCSIDDMIHSGDYVFVEPPTRIRKMIDREIAKSNLDDWDWR